MCKNYVNLMSLSTYLLKLKWFHFAFYFWFAYWRSHRKLVLSTVHLSFCLVSLSPNLSSDHPVRFSSYISTQLCLKQKFYLKSFKMLPFIVIYAFDNSAYKTKWTSLSAVPRKAVKFNHSLTTRLNKFQKFGQKVSKVPMLTADHKNNFH